MCLDAHPQPPPAPTPQGCLHCPTQRTDAPAGLLTRGGASPRRNRCPHKVNDTRPQALTLLLPLAFGAYSLRPDRVSRWPPPAAQTTAPSGRVHKPDFPQSGLFRLTDALPPSFLWSSDKVEGDQDTFVLKVLVPPHQVSQWYVPSTPTPTPPHRRQSDA